ncbi:pyridoxamine 5'-phosphate oxidase [Deinococcus sp. Arct2-2]|uniref:pyridoxamine 5'-phosphate oxidase family protein n=1 Tax=Deinococcus sp. Arct2-2 TaxID=2568653 RepID=UPI0010A3BE90|nr:pyridoxamine 5'-phosphate oxidase family protein [Deinococcus sp. Arct2-2]THF67933.1 pyridoxamine 5'-phosphate oxidase [Deinococcus sp. Arct2-2]
MPSKTLKTLAQQMAGINIAMFNTRTEGGHTAARPMSNNGEVEYDGTSYYFSFDQSRTVADIRRDAQVSLGFQSGKGLYVTVQGQASLTDDKAQMKDHWTPALDPWFKDGVDTPGIVMIQVKAERVHYWDTEGGKQEQGEIKL